MTPSPRTTTEGPARAFCLAALAGLSAWWCVAHGVAEDPRRAISFLTLVVAVLVFLPVAMSAAICALVVVPVAVLGPVAVGGRLLTRQPTGFRELVLDFVGIGLAVVPGYVRALSRVRSPRLWGFVVGSIAALPALVLGLPAAVG